ncbi:MAG: hypothetical protein N3C60_01070 [Calditerrivibrio sp.]|nr:hypothetical protein [Calditerrivibrio sp.]
MKKLIALLAIGLIAAPAIAQQWNMYGQVRLGAFYKSLDEYASGIGESDTDLTFGNFINSRIGANVKASDKLTATVELGIGSAENIGNPNLSANAVTTRLMFATYDFGGLKMRIGQDYAPTAAFAAFNQVSNTDNDLVGFGAINSARYSQLKFMAAGFELALSRPGLVSSDTTQIDVLLPRIEASYTLDVNPIKAKVYGGYQTYKVYDNGTAYVKENVAKYDDTLYGYILGAYVNANMGAVYSNLNAYVGSNLGTMGYLGGQSGLASNSRPFILSNGTLDNSKDYGFAINAGFKASDALTFEAGYGYAQTKYGAKDVKDDAQSYYVNAIVNLAKGFFIVPEISVEDKKKNGTVKEGKTTFYGAKFQANF